MKIGERIRKFREANNVKAVDLAKLLNVNLRTYYRYEKEERQISIYELIELAKFYGESLDYFCGLED